MKIFKSKKKLQKEILNKNNISFVPTMGGLHKGHISLIKRSQKYKGICLVSIFVNPKQFNKKKDFALYPRNITKDLIILKKLKVDIVYVPTYKDIFAFKPKKKLFLDKFSNKLCGKFRKSHFKGVVNVINRFLEIISPKYILLGIKDFQQLYLINSHIKKNKINTIVVPCKTIRETNGVACSTRNNNINKKKLLIAAKVYHYLKNKKKLINNDPSNFNFFKFKTELFKFGLNKIDYIKLYKSEDFKKLSIKNKMNKIFIAYYLNKVRLIDNI